MGSSVHKAFCFYIIACLLWISGCGEKSTPPPPKPDGSKWRIAYVEGGEWLHYKEMFCGLIWGLNEKGYFPDDVLRLDVGDCPEPQVLWRQLVEKQPSPYLHFLENGYYSAEWKDEKRADIKKELTSRLQNREIDLLLAMGTWSGIDFATSEHSASTMVLSASEPVKAGIVKGDKFSGIPHIHATHDPTRYLRQIRSFHEIVQFDSIGVVFEDTPEGRTWSNIEALETLGRELDFDVRKTTTLDTNVSEAEKLRLLKAGYARLAPDVEAFWLGALSGEAPEHLPDVIEPLFEHNVPTWGQLGEPHTRRGALLSISEADRTESGAFTASVFDKILRGTPPGEINQIYEDPKTLVINAETARRIGFDIPPGLMSVADKVFEEIETDNDNH